MEFAPQVWSSLPKTCNRKTACHGRRFERPVPMAVVVSDGHSAARHTILVEGRHVVLAVGHSNQNHLIMQAFHILRLAQAGAGRQQRCRSSGHTVAEGVAQRQAT